MGGGLFFLLGRKNIPPNRVVSIMLVREETIMLDLMRIRGVFCLDLGQELGCCHPQIFLGYVHRAGGATRLSKHQALGTCRVPLPPARETGLQAKLGDGAEDKMSSKGGMEYLRGQRDQGRPSYWLGT